MKLQVAFRILTEAGGFLKAKGGLNFQAGDGQHIVNYM